MIIVVVLLFVSSVFLLGRDKGELEAPSSFDNKDNITVITYLNYFSKLKIDKMVQFYDN